MGFVGSGEGATYAESFIHLRGGVVVIMAVAFGGVGARVARSRRPRSSGDARRRPLPEGLHDRGSSRFVGARQLGIERAVFGELRVVVESRKSVLGRLRILEGGQGTRKLMMSSLSAFLVCCGASANQRCHLGKRCTDIMTVLHCTHLLYACMHVSAI